MFKNLDKKRIVTGIVLIGVVFLVAWIDRSLVTWAFLGVALMFSFYESMRLYKIDDNNLYVYVVVLWILSYFYPNPDDLLFVALVVFVSVMLYSENVEIKKIFPLFYPVSSFLFLFALYQGFGMEFVIWLVIIVALTDTAAYFVGRAVGKRQFNKISPKKTIEGVIGGVVVATVAGTFYGIEYVAGPLAFVVSFVVSIASIFGDLFESYLKREAGVKDSGNVLPGHGGVLDRVDGYMFGVILMVILLRGLA